LAALQALQPLLNVAARRLAARAGADSLRFDPSTETDDRQLYDACILVRLLPRHASVYASFELTGGILQVMPGRDDRDARIAPTLQLDNMSCDNGRFLASFF
jgi:hypothetical protein